MSRDMGWKMSALPLFRTSGVKISLEIAASSWVILLETTDPGVAGDPIRAGDPVESRYLYVDGLLLIIKIYLQFNHPEHVLTRRNHYCTFNQVGVYL